MLPDERRTRIAVVEDDPAILAMVADLLGAEGYDVSPCPAGAALTALLARQAPDLILLDWRLPDSDGLALVAQLRATSAIPIIMLTGRTRDIDRILGLEVGADDYVVKPFNDRELVARVKAVLRRCGRETVRRTPAARCGYRFAGYVLDTEGRRLLDANEMPIGLTVAEFDLLLALVRAHGRVLSRNQLLDLTHGHRDDVFDRTIDVLILRLRRKIERNPQQPELIRTERGLGYIFDCRVEAFGPGPEAVADA